MEKALRIDLGGGKVAYARFREVAGGPAVVIAHGMTDHMNGRLEVNFSRLLERNGYSSLRYNAYDWPDDARDLCDMGLHEHLADLDVVLEWAGMRSPRVIALGHSFGGTCVVLRGSHGLAGGVLWDPAPQRQWARMNREIATHDDQRQEYVQRNRVAVIFSERLLEEMEAADAATAASAFTAPLLVVSASEWPHISEAGREYAERAPRSERVVFAGTDHNFTDDEAESSLFGTTLSWLRRTVPVSG